MTAQWREDAALAVNRDPRLQGSDVTVRTSSTAAFEVAPGSRRCTAYIDRACAAVTRACGFFARLNFPFGLRFHSQTLQREANALNHLRQRRFQDGTVACQSCTAETEEPLAGLSIASSSMQARNSMDSRPQAASALTSSPGSSRDNFVGDPQAMLQQLLGTIEACKLVGSRRQGDTAGRGSRPGMKVQTLSQDPGFTIWLAELASSAHPCVCSEARLHSVSVASVASAIYNSQDRLTWDAESFSSYVVLRQGTLLPAAHAVGDVIYCRMKAPTGLSDRDVVQERFLMRLENGDMAIVMTSLPEANAAALRRPAGSSGAVRAKTILSGYVMRKSDAGGVTISALSQTDLGGGIPSWVQSMAKKGSKRKMTNWTQRLEAYARTHGESGASLLPGEAQAAFQALESGAESVCSVAAANDAGARSMSSSGGGSFGSMRPSKSVEKAKGARGSQSTLGNLAVVKKQAFNHSLWLILIFLIMLLLAIMVDGLLRII